jgi:hypothetical protein
MGTAKAPIAKVSGVPHKCGSVDAMQREKIVADYKQNRNAKLREADAEREGWGFEAEPDTCQRRNRSAVNR